MLSTAQDLDGLHAAGSMGLGLYMLLPRTRTCLNGLC